MFRFIQKDRPSKPAPDVAEDYAPLIVAVSRYIQGEGTPQEEAALFEQLETDPIAAALAMQIIRDEALIRVCIAQTPDQPKRTARRDPGAIRPGGLARPGPACVSAQG